MKREDRLTGLVLLLALGLRLIALQSRSIQYDDAFSIFLAQRSLAEIVRGTAADTMPPLYYFLLHFWMAGGESLAWLRLLSVLLNLGSVALIMEITTRLVGRSAGLWAGLLAAISPLQIYHAQDLRMYALLATCQLGYIWFFARIWRPGENRQAGRWDWAGLLICGALAMYTHNLAVFVLAVPDVVLLIKREWKLLGRLIAAQAGIGVLAAPWLLMIPGQVAKIQHAFWTPQPGLVEVLQAVLLFHTNLPLTGIWLSVGAVVSVEALVLVLLEARKNWRTDKNIILLAALAGVPPLLLFAASYLMRPVFVTRGFLAAALGYLGLAGWTITRGWRRGGPLILAGFVIGAVIALPVHYTFNEFPRSPFQQAVTYLQTNLQPGEVVVHDNKLSYFPAHYYAPGLAQQFLPDEAGSHNDTFAPASKQAMQIFPATDLVSAVGNSQRVDFVVFQATIDEYRGMGKLDHPALAWLDAHYRLIEQRAFGDLLLYRYEK